jgi:hypothetical protein
MADHSLRPDEQALLDDLLERFDFTPVVVRLSETMLDKSIIDARAAIQAYLARTGLIDYALIGQGPEYKIKRETPFIAGGVATMRSVSFYRPVTKSGDPRFWVEGLKADAAAGDALVLAFTHAELVVIHLRGGVDEIAAALSPYLPSRFEERGDTERSVNKLRVLLAPIVGVPQRTKKAGPTGVGFTLEALLGVRANSFRGADFDGLELKAYRRGAITGPGKLVSLFSKTPQWLGVGKGIGLLKDYGYRDEDRGRLALYCTITTSRNTLGWSLKVNPAARRVSVCHEGKETLAYSFDDLEQRLQEKHPATLFVRASSEGTGANEHFWYDEVVLCMRPSLANLLELLEENLLGLDFTLHQKENGKARDHGYLWRIRESAIPRLYAYRRVIAMGGGEESP